MESLNHYNKPLWKIHREFFSHFFQPTIISPLPSFSSYMKTIRQICRQGSLSWLFFVQSLQTNSLCVGWLMGEGIFSTNSQDTLKGITTITATTISAIKQCNKPEWATTTNKTWPKHKSAMRIIMEAVENAWTDKKEIFAWCQKW